MTMNSTIAAMNRECTILAPWNPPNKTSSVLHRLPDGDPGQQHHRNGPQNTRIGHSLDGVVLTQSVVQLEPGCAGSPR